MIFLKSLFTKIKKNFFSILIVIFTLCLIAYSKTNIIAAKSGLSLWFNNVIPSLFPFFIATELLKFTNIPHALGKKLNKFMRPLFNVPGIGAYALIMGIISGYPVGAKIVSDFKNNNLCTTEEAERLTTFTNNSGPLFIIGTVGISLFSSISIGLLLLISHLLASITVGIIFRFWKRNSFKRTYNDGSLTIDRSFNSIGEILANSIMNSIKTIVLIGGFIVLFSVLISILNSFPFRKFIIISMSPLFDFIKLDKKLIIPFISGMIELTSGLNLVSLVPLKSLGVNVIICSFLLGFGGISVVLQVSGIIYKSNISVKPYILGKLLHGIISSVYTLLIIISFPYFSYLLF